MRQKLFAKLFLILALMLAAFSCSNYFGLTIAERKELDMKDKPALTVQRLPTILPCKKVDDHYEVEVLVIPEKNLRFPKPTDEYIISFDAFVTSDVTINRLRGVMLFYSFDIVLDTPVTSKDGRLTLEQKIVFPENIPNLRLALKNMRISAIVESEAQDGITFSLTEPSVDHITSRNVEIEYTGYGVPVVEAGEVAVTLKNADGSVFATIVGKTGEPLVLPQQIPLRRGYRFIRWRDVPSVFPPSNAEYDAVWGANFYYINYELYGGVNSQGNVESYKTDDGVIKLYPPCRNDNFFCGWYTDPEFKNQVTSINSSRAEDLTLHAKWLENVVGQITLYAVTPVIVGGQQGQVLLSLKMADGTTPPIELSYSEPGVLSIDPDGTVRTNEVPFDSSMPLRSVKKVVVTASHDNLKATCQIAVIPTTLTYDIVEDVWPDYSEITDFTIPEGIECLGYHNKCGTFEHCVNFKNVVTPQSLKTIGNHAFYELQNLASIEIPSGVTYIGDASFFRCENIKSIVLPKNLEYLGGSSFYNCSSLAGSVTIPDSLQEFGSMAFAYCDALEDVKVEDGVKSISLGAFYSCDNLKSAELPNSVERIEPGAFGYCRKLEKCEIPPNIVYIGGTAFQYCAITKSVFVLPKSLETIEDFAFYSCKIGEVIIPADGNLKLIGETNFIDATKVTVTGTLSSYDAEYWNKNIFYGFNGPYPYGNGTKFKELKFEKLPSGYVLYDNVLYLYSSDGKKLVYCPPAKVDSDGYYTIQKVITEIGDYALYGRWKGLSYYTNYIEKIGDYAFAKGITFDTVGKNVKHIGIGAFYESTKSTTSGSKITFSNTEGWYYTTDPNATSGTPIDVSNSYTNYDNLVYGLTWKDVYLKRN